MHDGITFELRGVPSVVICSAPFSNTAKAMAKACGLPDYQFAVIPHPVGSNSRDELRAKSEIVLPQALEILLGGDP
jgi:hypothetical protein